MRQITIDLQNPKTSDKEMYRLLRRLGNIKMSTWLIMGSNVGRVTIYLRDRQGLIGVLAQTLVKEWKEIICKDMEEDEDTDKGEEDEENIETDPNSEEYTRNNDNFSVILTPPPKKQNHTPNPNFS